MPTTMSTITAVLKDIYEGPIQEQLLQEVTTLRRVERTSEGTTSGLGGKKVIFPVHISRNQGIGARREMELLPLPGQQGYSSAEVNLKYLYGTVKMSGQAFELAKTNTQSFISAVDTEISGLRADLAQDLNRQVYGNGTGAIATSTAAYAVNTITCATSGVRNIQVGMYVDIYASDLTTLRAAGRTVTTVSTTANTVVVDGAAIAAGAIGDVIVRNGSIGPAGTQREITGFDSIVQTSGALYGLTDATWTANVDSNAGVARPISEGLMTLMADNINDRGGDTTVMFTTTGVRRSYANLLMSMRRFTNTQEFKGGFSGLAFTTDRGDIPMVVDRAAPPRTLWFINEKMLKLYREHDFSFMQRDGSMFERVTGYDAYQAQMYSYMELGCKRRNSFGKISDITES